MAVDAAVLLLMGPTASGKTALACELAAQRPCDLISVDSAQVYRGLDIGSAKPDAATLARFPHRLIDLRDPAQPYSAADFRRDALAAIAEAHAAGRLPVLVGGTMLYFRALLRGLAELPGADPALRASLRERMEREGAEALHRELAAVDPAAAAAIHPRNRQRIQRALEVYLLTGRPITELHAGGEEGLPWRSLQVAVAPADRAVLHRRIEQRFQGMLDQGLVDEVRGLHARPDLHPELPALRAVGYRQVWRHLDGELDYEEMRSAGLAATRQLAKRQLTWLRRWPGLHWLLADAEGLPVDRDGRPQGGGMLQELLKLLAEARI